MKRYLIGVCATLGLIAAMQGTAMAAGYSAEYGTPVIDVEKEAAWDLAQSYKTEVIQGKKHGAYADLSLMWDECFLYVYAQVHDSVLSAVSGNTYEQDSVELFIDENNAKTSYYERDDAQYRVNFENAQSFGDGADAQKFVSAAVKTDYGYIVEAAIPFRSIVPETNMVIGFELQVNDDGEGNGVRSTIAKLNDPTDFSYCNTENFADVSLILTDTSGFSDINGVTAETADVISKLSKKGVVNGYDDATFKPNENISREEFACMVSRMFDIYDKDAKCDFADVDKAAWFYAYVGSMTNRGYIQGISDTSFGSGENVKKCDAAAILNRILKASGIEDWEYEADDSAAVRYECAQMIYDAYKRLCRPIIQVKEKEPYSKELIPAADIKKEGNANPLMTQRFGADPFVMEYDGRVYVYMTGDNYRYDENGELLGNDYTNIYTVSVISSSDLVNWTDHGEIEIGGRAIEMGAAKWAKNSWAPCAAHKTINGKEKFFLYFADAANGIGVLESNSPTGPFYDPIGEPLINGATAGCNGVVWLFDPAVLIDDDGKAYLYFGGGMPYENGVTEANHPKTVRVIKLGDDMVSTEGEAVTIDAPAVFEDSGIHKYNGKYYYSYCSNFEGDHDGGKYPYGAILYMTSDNPMGPFEYQGMVLDNMYAFFEVGGNNHHAVFSFKDKWYIAYHAQTVEKYFGNIQGYRTTHLNELEYNKDGSIKPVTADFTGVSPIQTLNPFEKHSAAEIARMKGISTQKGADGMEVCDINNGDWISVRNVDFGDGAENVEISASVVNGGDVEIRLDKPDGTLAGKVNIADNIVSATLDKITGIHDLYFVFKGDSDNELFTMNSWQFGKE